VTLECSGVPPPSSARNALAAPLTFPGYNDSKHALGELAYLRLANGISRPTRVLIESPNGRPPSRATLTVAITLLMAIWAVNFLVVKNGLRHLPALTFASFRVVAAGLFMILIAPLCRRLPMFRQSPPVSPLATLPARADGHSARLHDSFSR
jgi:hypothetical protein